jgi:hypothetical protein
MESRLKMLESNLGKIMKTQDPFQMASNNASAQKVSPITMKHEISWSNQNSNNESVINFNQNEPLSSLGHPRMIS